VGSHAREAASSERTPLDDIAPILWHASTQVLQRVYGRTNLDALERVEIPKPLARSTMLASIGSETLKTAG